MRYFLFFVAVVFGLEVSAAECKNGSCSVRTVVNGSVQTVKNVSKGAIQVVTPPYKRVRCVNGKCNVR